MNQNPNIQNIRVHTHTHSSDYCNSDTITRTAADCLIFTTKKENRSLNTCS